MDIEENKWYRIEARLKFKAIDTPSMRRFVQSYNKVFGDGQSKYVEIDYIKVETPRGDGGQEGDN